MSSKSSKEDTRYSLRMITNYGIFISYAGNNKWNYYDNKQCKFIEYEEVRRDPLAIIIMCSSNEEPNNKQKYLRLSKMCGDGSSIDTIETKAYYSEWDSVWKFNDEQKYFYRKNENTWVKYSNGEELKEFSEVSCDSDGVLLHSLDQSNPKNGGVYYKLTQGSCFYGTTKTKVDDIVAKGTWINKRSEKGPFIGNKDY